MGAEGRLQSSRMLTGGVVTVLVLAVVSARSTGEASQVNSIGDEVMIEGRGVEAIGGGSLLSDLRFLYGVYEDCSSRGQLSACLKTRLLAGLDRASRTLDTLQLADGVVLLRDPAARVDQHAPLSPMELEVQLARSLEDREAALDKLIVDRVVGLFQSYTLQFQLGALDGSSNLAEGRARRNRLSSLLMVGMLLGGTLLPLKLGALALLAGKALIISKLALALAAIVGLKKLVGGGHGGGHDASYQVVSVPSHGGGHYKRSFQDAIDLAYKPLPTKVA